MILITGAQKSFALYKTIEEGVNHMWTASALQQHKNALLICDDDATLELRVKTVKYFKVRDEIFDSNAFGFSLNQNVFSSWDFLLFEFRYRDWWVFIRS